MKQQRWIEKLYYLFLFPTSFIFEHRLKKLCWYKNQSLWPSFRNCQMSTFGKSSSIKWTTILILTAALLQLGLRTFGAGVIITEEVAATEFSKALLQSVADDLDTSQAHLLHIASVAMIVAVETASELRGGGGGHVNNNAESEKEKVQELIDQIRKGFQAKQRQASFYNDLADQVYEQLNSLQATVTSEQFLHKIVEIAQRPEGDKGAVLKGESELSSGQALVKQRKDWATIEPEWEEAWKKHDHDQTKLLATTFYFVLWVVNKLDWDGVRRAKHFSKLLKGMDKDGMLRGKHFSINDDVSSDRNEESKSRFSVFLADLLSTRVLARMDRELLPKVIGIGRKEFAKFVVRTSLLSFNPAILWRKIINFEFGLENRGPAIRFRDENKETGRKAYDLLDGLDEVVVKGTHFNSYLELARSFREKVARRELQKNGGDDQVSHKVVKLMDALLERTVMEMESPLMRNMLTKYSNKKGESKSDVKQLLAFYVRFFNNVTVYAMQNGQQQSGSKDKSFNKLQDWLRAMQAKLTEKLVKICVDQLNSRVPERRRDLQYLKTMSRIGKERIALLDPTPPLYKLEPQSLEEMEDDDVPTMAERAQLKTAVLMAEKVNYGDEEEQAKFVVRLSVRPFIGWKQQKHLLDFACGPRTALADCVQFVEENVDFVQIIKKLPDEKKASSDEERELPDARCSDNNVCNGIKGNAKWCTALKAIDAEFAKWTGMANHLRGRLLDGIAETFKSAANSHRPHSSKVNVDEQQQQSRKHENQVELESSQEALALFSVYYARLASLLMPVSGAAAEIGKFNAKLYTSVNNALKKEYRYKQKLDDNVSVVKH